MSFRLAATLLSAVCAILCAIFLLIPASYITGYGVTPDASGLFIGRRASPMLLGFALILWLARDAEPSPLRDALCWGVIVSFVGIAATGVFEYARGLANGLIVLAAAAELLIAGIFARFVARRS